MMKIFSYKLFYYTLVFISFFEVNPGVFGQENRIELNSIDFIGNEFFSNSELEKIIISKESPNWLSQFLNSFTSFGNPASYFDSLDLQDDLAILRNHYKSNGFFKTKISARFTLEEDGDKNADLYFEIKENEPSIIRNYNLNGLEILNSNLFSELQDLLNIDTSLQYSEVLIGENSEIVLDYLQDEGYMLVQSSVPVVDVDTTLNLVDVSVDFNLGNRYRISNVRVSKGGPGKDLVSDELLDEIANIEPGRYYSYGELKLAQIRLYRTNLFSSVAIAGSVQDTSGSTVPVDIITRVGLLNELAPEIIGINEENRFKLGLGLTYSNKNFLGDARKLTLGTSAAAQNITEFLKEANLASDNIFGYADLRMSVEQPFLFGRAINTLLETFYTIEKKKNQWNAKIYGAKLNLNFELPRYTYLTALSTHFSWQNSEYIFKEDYINDRLGDSVFTGSFTTKSTSAILGVNLISNNTNDLLFPTNGYSISVLAEDGNFIPYMISKIGSYNFSQPAYYKLVLTLTGFLPDLVFDVIGSKIKVGNINAYEGNLIDIPYNQRLTAGGSNSLRGWESNELPISDYVLPQNYTQSEIENIARNITPGGFFLFEGSLEGRELFYDNFGFALFLDYGNVWNSYQKLRFDEIAVAAGFGFRYYSDFAPIRLDFGFKAYDPDDRRSFFTRLKHSPFLDNLEFQIGIGEAF